MLINAVGLLSFNLWLHIKIYIFSFKLPLNNKRVMINGFIPSFKGKIVFSSIINKICSKKFWLRALFLFVVSCGIKIAIQNFWGVNILLQLFNPISLVYWFFMSIFSTALISKEIFTKRYWKSVIYIFVLGYTIKLCNQNLDLIGLCIVILSTDNVSSCLSQYLGKGLFNVNMDLFKLFKLPHKIGEGFPLDHNPEGQGFAGNGGSTPNGGSPSNGHTNNHTNNMTTDEEYRRPNVHVAWHYRAQQEIERVSIEIRDTFTRENPTVTPVHTQETLRLRASAYANSSRIHSEASSYGPGTPTYHWRIREVNNYNAWLDRNNPPFLNERIPD